MKFKYNLSFLAIGLIIIAFYAFIHPKMDEQIDPILTEVDQIPVYGNCTFPNQAEQITCSNNNVIQYIFSNIAYPEVARKSGIEGTVILSFIIEKDGSISFDPDSKKVILQNPGGGCAEEALSIIKKMDKWTPGVHEGKKVKVQFTMPIKFKLEDEED